MKTIVILSVAFLIVFAIVSPRTEAAEKIHIAAYKGGCKAAISFTFDDGFKKELEDAARLTESVGIRGTFFVIPGQIEKQSWRAQWPRLKQLHEKGYEIGNHSMTHPKLHTLSDQDLDYQVNKAYDIIKEKIGVAPFTFCYPGGTKRDERVKKKVYERHYAAREKQYFYGKQGNKEFTTEKGNKWVDQAIQKGEWMVPMIHCITGKGFAPFPSEQVFVDHLKYVVSKKDLIWCAPMREVGKYVQERDKAELKTEMTGRKAEITLTCPLKEEVFDFPLTVIIPVSGAEKAEAQQEGQKESPAVTVTDSAVCVDIVPNRGKVTVTW